MTGQAPKELSVSEYLNSEDFPVNGECGYDQAADQAVEHSSMEDRREQMTT